MAKKSSSELKKPKKNNKKSSKKFGPDAVAMKHKSSAQKTENPFETIWSRRKFDILGKKRKGEERRVGLSRSLAIEKRQKTLLKEYEQSGKSSVFMDKRIGEQNEELGDFDKSIMRYQRERQQQLKSSKKSKYNLSDGEDDELDILGGEQFLGKDDFDDEVPLQDDEDEQTGSQSNSTFMDLQSPTAMEQAMQTGSEGDTRRKSDKEVWEEIKFKSKYFKAQKAKDKEENEELMDQLDNQFTSMVQSKALVSVTLPNKMNALKALVNKLGSSEDTKKNDVVVAERSVVAQKEEPDLYDKLLFSMALDKKARASDRTKTPEEIAEEEKELLERLEAERQKRMVAADESSGEEDNALNDENESTKRLRTSGDDLGDSFSLGEEQVTKVGWLEKVFKKKESDALEESDGSDDGDGDDDDEDEDVDDSEDEEDGTDDDGEEIQKINSVKGWEQSDDELDINSEEDEEDVDQVKTTHQKTDPEKSELKVVSADSGEKKAVAKQGELPYTLEAPKSLEEFNLLIENRSHDQIIEAIRRIRKYSPITIAAEDRKKENRKKVQVFYGVLLQYFAVLSNKKPLDIKLLNSLVNPLLEMSAEARKENIPPPLSASCYLSSPVTMASPAAMETDSQAQDDEGLDFYRSKDKWKEKITGGAESSSKWFLKGGAELLKEPKRHSNFYTGEGEDESDIADFIKIAEDWRGTETDEDPIEIPVNDCIELWYPWRRAVLVKVLGRNISFRILQQKLNFLWGISGELDIVDLDSDYYVIRFASKEDYEAALSMGPWTIQGHYLTVRKWRPFFQPSKQKILSTLVWVRFPGVPHELFENEDFLLQLARRIGKPGKVDVVTSQTTRAKFVRICVEMNLNQVLRTKVVLNGNSFAVEYEGLNQICFECGKVGHKTQECTLNQPPPDQHTGSGKHNPSLSTGPTPEKPFGPWMIATNRKRRPPMGQKQRADRQDWRNYNDINTENQSRQTEKSKGGSGGKTREDIYTGSRFEVLAEDEVLEDIQVEGNLNNMNGLKEKMTEAASMFTEANVTLLSRGIHNQPSTKKKVSEMEVDTHNNVASHEPTKRKDPTTLANASSNVPTKRYATSTRAIKIPGTSKPLHDISNTKVRSTSSTGVQSLDDQLTYNQTLEDRVNQKEKPPDQGKGISLQNQQQKGDARNVGMWKLRDEPPDGTQETEGHISPQ